MRVLIVEDSDVLRDSLAQGLREAGYAVDAVADGTRGLIHAQGTDYDVVILDWRLPEMDGLTVLSRMREKRLASAVLMLTARDTVEDRVTGLSAGADDYLVKPFAFEELLARVKSLTRRRHGQRSPLVRVGPLVIDMDAREVRIERGAAGQAPRAAAHDVTIDLTPREYALLEYLAARVGRPASRAELEEHIYDDSSQVYSNAIDSAIAALRGKLESAGCPPLIRTRRKVGYVLVEPAP